MSVDYITVPEEGQTFAYVKNDGKKAATYTLTEEDYEINGQTDVITILPIFNLGKFKNLGNDQEYLDSLYEHMYDIVEEKLHKFQHHHRLELDYMYALLQKIDIANRSKDAEDWVKRTYVPKNQKRKDGKQVEKKITFDNYIFHEVLKKVGLEKEKPIRFNADGSRHISLEEQLESCGMGYLTRCNKEDLGYMYEQARDMLVEANQAVATPGMLMARVWQDQHPQANNPNSDQYYPGEVLRRKIQKIQHSTPSNAAVMAALFIAAQQLSIDNKVIGKVKIKGNKRLHGQKRDAEIDIKGVDSLKSGQHLVTTGAEKLANRKRMEEEITARMNREDAARAVRAARRERRGRSTRKPKKLEKVPERETSDVNMG